MSKINYKIPPVTHEWLEKRYDIYRPKAPAEYMPTPEPEIVSKKLNRVVGKQIYIRGSTYKHEDIVHCLENPEVLPEEMEERTALTYDEVNDFYYEEAGTVYNRLTHTIVTGLVQPKRDKNPITANKIGKILRERVDMQERNARVERLELEVRELIEFKKEMERLFKRLGVE